MPKSANYFSLDEGGEENISLLAYAKGGGVRKRFCQIFDCHIKLFVLFRHLSKCQKNCSGVSLYGIDVVYSSVSLSRPLIKSASKISFLAKKLLFFKAERGTKNE